jgi:cbb3-type cytochrome oxidase cytochrome c subunit
MKGLVPLILGIFGTFSFSWLGLTVIPNYQIGHLNPQMDEEGTDVYPAPKSGMAERGRRVYVANGCFYCHSEQVRADYAAGDIDRKWGERRSAPRDYIFDRPVLLGKERMGPDLSNIGKRAPVEGESPTAANAPAGGASPATAAASPAPSPAAANAPPTTSPAQSPAGSPAPPATSPAQSPSGSPPSPAQSPTALNPSPPPAPSPNPVTGDLPMYSAAWHHRHLYSPRSVTLDSNMPAFRFLYEKRPVGSEPAANAVQLTASDAPPVGWEVVPTYEAECLVAYLMSLDQSHPLKEVKSAAPAPGAAPGAPPPAPPPAGAPASSPAPPGQPPPPK